MPDLRFETEPEQLRGLARFTALLCLAALALTGLAWGVGFGRLGAYAGGLDIGMVVALYASLIDARRVWPVSSVVYPQPYTHRWGAEAAILPLGLAALGWWLLALWDRWRGGPGPVSRLRRSTSGRRPASTT